MLLGAGRSAVADLGITTIGEAFRPRVTDITVLDGLDGERAQRAPRPWTQKEPDMFTGIVEELGTVAAVEDQGDAIRLTIRATTVLEDAGLGDSISVNGCCLTVAERDGDTWTADVMQETLDKTSLYGVRPGDRVNLERAVTAATRLGGHIVQGHVDAVGTVARAYPQRALGGRRDRDARPRWRATSSTRARSPSTASASPSSRPGTTGSRSA